MRKTVVKRLRKLAATIPLPNDPAWNFKRMFRIVKRAYVYEM